jgi:hypothetical protein
MIARALRVAGAGVFADRRSGLVHLLLACPNQDSNASIAFDNQVLWRFMVTLEGTRDLLCVAN